MKKTHTINLNGIIFHIDEDAYQILNQYLDRLSSHFASQEDGKEIVADIEARMAELLLEKLGDNREVISIGDVEAVIGIMGLPEQFDQEEEENETTSEDFTSKRFFRDPDHKMIAGVCSGLGAYFHIDPVIVRLLFLISLFAGGFGILLYFILWIVIPEATTASEKLQMRGERVTISTIEKTIRKETAGIKEQFSSKRGNPKTSYRDPSKPTAAEKVVQGTGKVIMVFIQVLLIVIGVAITFIGIGTMIMLLAVLFGWGGSIMVDPDFMIMSLPEMMNLILSCDMNTFFLQISLLLLLGIPLIGLMYLGIRLVLKIDRIPYFSITLLNIWIIGLFICAYYGFRIYQEFKTGESVKTETVIEQPMGDTLYVMLDKHISDAEESFDRIALFDDLWIYRDDQDRFYLPPYLMVRPSKSGQIEIRTNSMSRGINRDEAYQRASMIVPRTEITGDTLWLNAMIPVDEGNCWKGEHIRITLELPEGKVVSFGEGIWRHQTNRYYRRIHLDEPEWYIIKEHEIEEIELFD